MLHSGICVTFHDSYKPLQKICVYWICCQIPIPYLTVRLTAVQTDKRNLGTKAMLAEIRELGEQFKAEDDVPEALGATYPFSARLRPFLVLDCTDK